MNRYDSYRGTSTLHMTALLLIGVSLMLVVICGLFVAAEFSLIAVNKAIVERLATKGDSQAHGVAKALASLSTQLSSAQIGITVTNLGIGFLAEPAIAQILEAPLRTVGLPHAAIPGVSISIGIALATVVTMIFGELVPKNIALAKPLTTAKIVQRPLLVFTKAMKYPIKFLNQSANLLLRQFGVQPREELASARSADELLSLVRRSAEKGTLAKETALMLERSLTFGEQTALDVMTPRVRVKAVQTDDSVSKALDLAKVTGLSRFPVYDASLDDIVGILHIKHAFSVPIKDRGESKVKQIMRQPVLVPSTIELEPLLDALRKGGLQIAIVIDEFGGMDGIVTIEDVLEELVGDVRDEHDHTSAAIRKQADGSWLLSGLLRPDEIAEELTIFLPEEDDVETLGGLLIYHLEHIPKVNETLKIKAVNRDGDALLIRLTVIRMDGNRVDRVRLEIYLPPKDSEDHSA